MRWGKVTTTRPRLACSLDMLGMWCISPSQDKIFWRAIRRTIDNEKFNLLDKYEYWYRKEWRQGFIHIWCSLCPSNFMVYSSKYFTKAQFCLYFMDYLHICPLQKFYKNTSTEVFCWRYLSLLLRMEMQSDTRTRDWRLSTAGHNPPSFPSTSGRKAASLHWSATRKVESVWVSISLLTCER